MTVVETQVYNQWPRESARRDKCRMNLAAVDLNLLVALEALLDERSVTRAARRIGLSQPAMSSALNRLRTLFADELFIRTSRGMRPTPRAAELTDPLRSALTQVRRTLGRREPFNPATADGRHFTIAVTDYADLVVIPKLTRMFRKVAPNVELRVKQLDRAMIFEQIDRNEVDVAIAGHLRAPPRFVSQRLFQERFVCIAAPDNPRILKEGALTAEVYLASPHALFTLVDDLSPRGTIDNLLEAEGVSRRIVATFPHITAIPFAVVGTDLIATLSMRIADTFSKVLHISVYPFPFPGLRPFNVDLVYSARGESDTGLLWLRRAIVEITSAT
jgi:DNA-binding transcriptional LysR family regulator